MNKNDKKIYHYYFGVYKDGSKKVTLRLEPYVYESELPIKFTYKSSGMNDIIVICKYDRHRMNLERDLNRVISGRSIYMLERDDEKALDLFYNHIDEKLLKLKADVNNLINIQDFIRNASFDLEE